jgi:ceramide glucosyltransferase
MIRDTLMLVLLAGGTIGCLSLIVAAFIAPSFTERQAPAERDWPAVTVLKPLHGDEPSLFENLATFCRQDYPGAVQIVFGVISPGDPAIAVVERLRAAFPGKALGLIVDPHLAGSNPKVANLVNMSGRIAHDVIVIADSDIRVEPGYLKRVVAALDRAGAGAVTCPYYGISTGNLWSQFSRLTIDGHFLPGVMIGAHFRLSRPCLGSTVALGRRSLAAIGGFQAFADTLADDYAMGEALALRGEPVSVLPLTVGHVCGQQSFGELWRHELRWALTIRTVDPVGYIGWTVTQPLPLAMLALCLGAVMAPLALALAAVACRAAFLMRIERAFGLPPHPYWLIPLRDLLSFATLVAGFVARDVSWRGQDFHLMPEGTLTAERRFPSS